MRVGHDPKGRRRRTFQYMGLQGMTSEPSKIVHQGITRSPRERVASELPLTEHQQRVLDAIDAGDPGDKPFSATKLAEAVGGSRPGVTSTLYVLQDRGLVERVPYKGWRRL
jgi:DNA-binding MarR family transcriptional regulator